MKEVYRSVVPWELYALQGVLEEEGIISFVFDEHTGSLYQGVGGIYPRLMVADDDFERAQKIMKDAGFD